MLNVMAWHFESVRTHEMYLVNINKVFTVKTEIHETKLFLSKINNSSFKKKILHNTLNTILLITTFAGLSPVLGWRNNAFYLAKEINDTCAPPSGNCWFLLNLLLKTTF